MANCPKAHIKFQTPTLINAPIQALDTICDHLLLSFASSSVIIRILFCIFAFTSKTHKRTLTYYPLCASSSHDSPSAQLYAALRVLLCVPPCGVRSGRSVV